MPFLGKVPHRLMNQIGANVVLLKRRLSVARLGAPPPQRGLVRGLDFSYLYYDLCLLPAQVAQLCTTPLLYKYLGPRTNLNLSIPCSTHHPLPILHTSILLPANSMTSNNIMGAGLLTLPSYFPAPARSADCQVRQERHGWTVCMYE